MVTGSSTCKFFAATCAVALSGLIVGAGSVAQAQTTSVVATGGYLVFPKIVAHTTAAGANPALAAGDLAQDTVIQLTNTSTDLIEVNCYYINANRHCGTPPGAGAVVCRDDSECPAGVRCIPGWQSQDFQVELTPRQPLGWTVSAGLELPCSPVGNNSCANNASQQGLIPPVGEDPFIGELRCVEVIADVPVLANDLKGEATIVESGPFGAPTDVLTAAYNAVSFAALSDGGGGDALCLGGTPTGAACAAQYTPCGTSLSLQHYFDGAVTPEGVVNTELTLSPCSARVEAGGVIVPENRVVAMVLVYNEFEQRFSTGTVLNCVENIRLVDIDTPAGPAGDASSVFSIGTQGTLGGQTRIKGTSVDDNGFGPGLVGLAHQYYSPQAGGAPTASSAHHVNVSEFAAQNPPDAVYLPLAP